MYSCGNSRRDHVLIHEYTPIVTGPFQTKGGIMYCKNCGILIDNDSKYCSKCGSPTFSVTSTTSEPDNSQPIITVRPVFIPWLTILAVIPIQLFMTVWAGGFFGGFSLIALKFLNIQLPIWSTFAFFGALAFFGIPAAAYFARKNTYSRTEYKFYSDHLDYAEGFWTVENKTIKYKNITEVNMRQGVIQKKYGLGTIILSTPAMGFQRGRARSGILVSDIENPAEIYEKLKELIG